MEGYLLDAIEARGLPRAMRRILGQALQAYDDGDAGRMLDLSQMGRKVAIECNDRVAEAVSLIFVGAAYCQKSKVRDAAHAFESAQSWLCSQPSWRQRLNESIAYFGLGVALSRWPDPPVAKVLASYQHALSMLESVRYHYLLDADDRAVDVVDDLCAELRTQIDSATQPPFIDAEFAATNSTLLPRWAYRSLAAGPRKRDRSLATGHPSGAHQRSHPAHRRSQRPPLKSRN